MKMKEEMGKMQKKKKLRSASTPPEDRAEAWHSFFLVALQRDQPRQALISDTQPPEL